MPTTRYSDQHGRQSHHNRPRDHPLRSTHLLAERGDAGVAGKGEEAEPAGAEHTEDVTLAEIDAPEIGVAARPAGADHHGQRSEGDDEQHPGDRNRPGQPTEVDADDGDDGHDGDESGPLGPRVAADGQRHRRARRGLADDESPPGHVPP